MHALQTFSCLNLECRAKYENPINTAPKKICVSVIPNVLASNTPLIPGMGSGCGGTLIYKLYETFLFVLW